MADPRVNILITATDKTKGVLGGIGSALGGLGKIAAGAAIGGIALATGAMVGGVKAATDWGKQLDNLQDLLGTSAQESAGLAVMANRIGLSSDDLGRSLSIMTRGLFDAEGQLGPTGEALDNLGISLVDANGVGKDSTALFQEIADVVGKMPDGFEKSSIMMDVFGRSGVEMGDLLAAAADGGVAKFQEEADKLGLNFSQEKIDNVIEFGKQTEFLKSAFQGVAAELGAALLPAITGFVNDSVMPFIQEYGPKLTEWLGTNIPKAIDALSVLWTETLQPALATVWAFIKDNVIPILVDIYDWLSINLPIAIGVIGEWLGKLRAWWQEHGDEIMAKAKEIWDTITNTISEFVDWAGPKITEFLAAVKGFWDEHGAAITEKAKWLYDTITKSQEDYQAWALPKIEAFLESVKGFWEAHGDEITAKVTAIWDGVKEIWNNFKDAWADLIELFHLAQEGKWYEFGEKLRSILDDAWAAIKEAAGKAVQAVKDFFTETDWGSVGDGILKGIAKGITSGLQWLKDAAIKAAKAALEAAKGFLGIKSPSSVFAEVGEDMMKGMALGIGRASTLPATATVGAASQSLGMVTNYNYYLSAQYAYQSPNSLAQDARLLEMLHS